jgi:hypothetical protein
MVRPNIHTYTISCSLCSLPHTTTYSSTAWWYMAMSTYKWSIGSMWFVSNHHIYCKTQNNTAQQLCYPLEQFVSTMHYVHSNREWRSSPDVVALVSPPKKWWGSLYYIYCRLGKSESATADADLLGFASHADGSRPSAEQRVKTRRCPRLHTYISSAHRQMWWT